MIVGYLIDLSLLFLFFSTLLTLSWLRASVWFDRAYYSKAEDETFVVHWKQNANCVKILKRFLFFSIFIGDYEISSCLLLKTTKERQKIDHNFIHVPLLQNVCIRNLFIMQHTQLFEIIMQTAMKRNTHKKKNHWKEEKREKNQQQKLDHTLA